MRKFLSICLCMAMVLPVYSCTNPEKRYSASYTDVFDTVVDFTAYCSTESEFRTVSESVHAELVRLHRLFDIYNEYPGVPNAAYINRAAGGTAVETEPELTELIKTGKSFFAETGGRLNFALGSLLSVWHFYRAEGTRVPAFEELSESAKHTDPDKVIVDGNTVAFSDPLIKLDFGAFAKGYAAAAAAETAKKLGISDFALNLGGNVVVSGTKNGEKWNIGVQDPEGGILTTLHVSGVSVVTSGDYQRYYEVDGVRYHHIIDSETLYPCGFYRSVTVVCADNSVADALSTALFCLDIESGRELARKYSAEALWILPSGETVRTGGFADYE